MAKKRREIDRRLEMIRELANEKSYDEGWKMIEDLDPEELDSVQDIKAMAEIAEKTGHYDLMKSAYLHLFNLTNVRRNLKTFIEVLIRIGDIGEAKVYLKEFEKMDGAVADDFDLRYSMAMAVGVDLDEKIRLLEEFKKEEYMENWGKKLAEAYRQAGREDDYKNEMADLHLWFGGARILPDEEEEQDPEELRVVAETEENLAARLEAESEALNAISSHVGKEVSKIVEDSDDGFTEQHEPTLDDMLSATGKQKIEQLEVEPTGDIGRLDVDHPEPQPVFVDPKPQHVEEERGYEEPVEEDEEDEEDGEPDQPVRESVSTPKTASGAPLEPEEPHISFEAQYLNRMGQAETVGEPVRTIEPVKAKKFEELFAADENYEESPPDMSDRGIRYYTTRDVIARLRRRESEPPHFVLAGGEERITLTMTKKISKELTRLGYTSAQKVMRITAERMNSIKLEEQIDRLIGRCLLVTEAAELTKESVHQLMWAMHEFGEEFVVVLSGPFDEIDCFLDIYPELAEQLGYKVRMMY